jgi:hypothetical protein
MNSRRLIVLTEAEDPICIIDTIACPGRRVFPMTLPSGARWLLAATAGAVRHGAVLRATRGWPHGVTRSGLRNGVVGRRGCAIGGRSGSARRANAFEHLLSGWDSSIDIEPSAWRQAAIYA